MSDRLDIVRLIDAKVSSTRRTVTRSMQLAEAAKGELHIHQDWIRQHNERSEGDLRRHQRRVKRRERIDNNRRFAKSVLLFVPRLCAWAYRALASCLRKGSDLLFAGSASLGTASHALSRTLMGGLAAGLASAGAGTSRLGLMLAASLWFTLTCVGKAASALARAMTGASLRGLTWLAPRATRFALWLIATVSLSLSRVGTGLGGVALEAGGGARRQASHLATRLRPRAKARAPERRPAANLDPGRLQQAAFIRLHAEHQRLQSRIHALDTHYAHSHSHRGRGDTREWVELRKLAHNARRLFEVQERQVLGRAAPITQAASRAPQGEERHPPRPRLPLRAGHAVYAASALPGSHRRA